MYRLFQLIYQYRAFLLFLFLEFISIWMLFRQNPYYSAVYFRSANLIAGSLYEARANLVQYMSLSRVNQTLAEENARMRSALARMRLPVLVQELPDSSSIAEVSTPYDYIAARVINNSISKQHNFITINKGSRHGIEPGMGVISADGAVGRVLSVSRNYAAVTSLLNVNMIVSARHMRSGSFCTVNWDGRNYRRASALYLPRHVEVREQDSVFTSGYSDVFPENILIGTIRQVSIDSDATFYNLSLDLSSDFSSLSYVYIVRIPGKEEREELESSLGSNE